MSNDHINIFASNQDGGDIAEIPDLQYRPANDQTTL